MTVLLQRLAVFLGAILGSIGIEVSKKAAIIITVIAVTAGLIAALKLFFTSLLNQVTAAIPYGDHIAAFFPESLTTALSIYISAHIAAWLYHQQIKVIQYRLF